MSNRLFQGIIYQMKDAVDRTIGVIDETGVVISCSELGKIGEIRQGIREEISYTSDFIKLGGCTYKAMSGSPKSDYIVFVDGEDKAAENLALLLSITLGNIKVLYDEKHDKSSFIKNIILDNILPSDIYIKSKELHFAADVYRIVFLIKFTEKNDVVPYDVLLNMFPGKNKDYIINVGEHDTVLVKEVKPNFDMKEIEKMARSIADTISTEFYSKVLIGIGTAVDNLKDLSKSYKEAQIALEVGKVFDTDKDIITYDNLGIGRLIYQLPRSLCEMFLQEVFKRGPLETIDRDTLVTIQSFFENNLNVSETSRKLFVHRNTLVYRLEKIYKLTGLDLRKFDQAIVFKVAMMVHKYLISNPMKI